MENNIEGKGIRSNAVAALYERRTNFIDGRRPPLQ
jgi:hypothetical protein